MVNLGLSFSLFKVWFRPVGRPFKGYTAASNQGLLGAALIETPIVDFVMRDLEDEEPFMNLHGSTVDVTISCTTFVQNGGIATIKLALVTDGQGPRKEISFGSSDCRGASATAGDIRFVATLLELPAEEQDPTGVTVVPF
jgi:hypothetical protein